MTDNLLKRLRDGIVYRLKRWSGDTHDDLGGSFDEDAIVKIMADAADEIERLRAALHEIAETQDTLNKCDELDAWGVAAACADIARAALAGEKKDD